MQSGSRAIILTTPSNGVTSIKTLSSLRSGQPTARKRCCVSSSTQKNQCTRRSSENLIDCTCTWPQPLTWICTLESFVTRICTRLRFLTQFVLHEDRLPHRVLKSHSRLTNCLRRRNEQFIQVVVICHQRKNVYISGENVMKLTNVVTYFWDMTSRHEDFSVTTRRRSYRSQNLTCIIVTSLMLMLETNLIIWC